MSARTVGIPLQLTQGRSVRRFRQRGRWISALVLAGTAATVAGCYDPAHDLKVGTVGYVTGFAGVVASQEPRATVVAQNVLSSGGTAADAAVALAFTLTVTLPSSAGIGGGGVCVVHDHTAKKTETLSFLSPAGGGGPIPGVPRGLYLLHSRFGALPWEQVVSPAETIARFGEPVSRSLARDLKMLPRIAGGDPYAYSLFGRDQRVLGEGEVLTQVDLASVLGRLRTAGPGDLYSGVLAREYVDVANRQGASLSIETLRNWFPQWSAVESREIGNEVLLAPSEGAGKALLAAWDGVAVEEGSASSMPGGATGFVVADRLGNAVSCALTMNAPYGTGRMLPGMGLFLAAPTPETGESAIPLAVGLQMNQKVNEFRFAVAAAGSGAAANAARVAKGALPEKTPVAPAVEALADKASGDALVVAAYCPEGIPPYPRSCAVAVDPRGSGYGILVGKSD